MPCTVAPAMVKPSITTHCPSDMLMPTPDEASMVTAPLAEMAIGCPGWPLSAPSETAG